MVLREVCEYRDVELNRRHSFLCQRMGRDFHHAGFAADSYHVIEEFAVGQNVWGCHRRWEDMLSDNPFDGANESARFFEGAEQMANEIGSGRFAICPGDADE